MTNKPFVLGVTGGIGSGKSLVGKMLEAQGIPVIDTDHLAHELLNSPNPAYDKIVARFGQGVVTVPGGPIDRKKLGAYVFNYERMRAELEAIMHPAIAALQAERIAALSQHDIVAVLVPLLFESGSEHKYNEIWCVTVNREVQMARLELRDKTTRDQIMKRINAQWAQERKVELSDVVIDNSFSMDDTLAQVVKHLAATRARIVAEAVVTQTPAIEAVADKSKSEPVESTAQSNKETKPPVAVPVTVPTDSGKTTSADAAGTAPAEATGTQTPPGLSEAEKAAANERYRGILAGMAQVGSAEALDELGNIVDTQHKEADATMTMVVKSGEGAPTRANGSAVDGGSERELTVDVKMTVRNRPGKTGNGGNGCSCGCDNCKNGCACKSDCGCDCKPPAPKPNPDPNPNPDPAPKPNPAPDPNPNPNPGPRPNPPAPVPQPNPDPGVECKPWYRRGNAVLALIALLAFLGFLAFLACQHGRPVVIQDPTTVTINKPPVVEINQPTTVVIQPPTAANQPPVVANPPAANGNDDSACLNLSVETLSEPPAFSLPFVQNDVRWSTAVWTVHYDDGKGYCRNSIVEGHDRLGRLTVRQFYGPHLAYRGQITVKYFGDGTAQINRFDSYNLYQGRDSHRVNANEVR